MRLFVAITLNDDIRQALARVQARLRPTCDGVRWVEPELLHLTVKFLGDVADGRVPDVSEGLALAASQCSPFELDLTGCGCFPEGKAVRVIWAGVQDPTGALRRCVELVEVCMAELDFPREDRPFAAHLTLGRVKEDRSGGRLRTRVAEASLDPRRISVAALTLMESVLSPRGPLYTPVATCPLAGR